MAMSADAQAAADQVTARLMADPVLGPLLQRQAAGQPFDAAAADARLKALGIELPKGMWISGGKVQHENMTLDNIGKALKIGIPVAIGAYGVGALAGAGGAASGGAAGTGAATTVGTSAGTAAAGGSFWSRLAGPLIGAGAGVASTAIQAHSNSEAAKLEAEAADKALALQTKMYEERRSDEQPYRQIGTGALGLLGQGMGIDMTPPKPAAPLPVGGSQTPAATANSGGTMAALGPPQPAAAPSMVTVKSPTGQVGQIPAAMLPNALAAGGTQVHP